MVTEAVNPRIVAHAVQEPQLSKTGVDNIPMIVFSIGHS